MYMSKAYKVISKTIPVGERKGETVYTVSPVSFGLLTTDEVAKQISTESTATPADVKAVLDRSAHYVKENLKKGYDVELLGFGTLTIRFVINHSVGESKMATGKIVSSLMPAFRPSYTMHKGTRIYNLLPEKVTLVNFADLVSNGTILDPNSPSEGGSNEPTDPDNGGSGSSSDPL